PSFQASIEALGSGSGVVVLPTVRAMLLKPPSSWDGGHDSKGVCWMRVRTFLLCLGCALLLALPVFSQGIPTGTLAGRVSADNQTLPGVTVSVSSPALQGRRSATTN